MKTKIITLSNKILATIAAAAAGIFILSTGCSGTYIPGEPAETAVETGSDPVSSQPSTSSDYQSDEANENDADDETETTDPSDETDEGYANDDDDSEIEDGSGDSGDESSETVPAETGEGSTITHNGITWTFSKTVTYGRFVTGDYWVVGPVTVEEVSPSPRTTANGYYINGSMINPPNGGHSYDSRSVGYTDKYKVTFPVEIEADSSLVSTISEDENETNPRPSVYSASVLTVLTDVPSEGSFRPGIIGTEKRIYNTSEIQWDRLPSLNAVSSTPTADTIKKNYERWFERPWLLHNGGWTHRYIMPVQNSPSYHQDVALLLSHGAVLCMTAWGDRTVLVQNYIQVAIDYYTMLKSPGTGAYNYRWPVIFAGIMLNDDEMRDMWVNGDNNSPSYGEGQLYVFEETRRSIFSEMLSYGESWTGATYLWRDGTSGNDTEHEILHPEEWGWLEEAYPGGGEKQETYRRMHSAYMTGFSLCARAFGAEDNLAFPYYLEYTDRWMSETPEHLAACGHPVYTHPVQTSKSQFVDDMWKTHRNSF